MANEYDVVVIGSGTGGYVAAIRAAQLGLRTAVVERAPVLGGTCLNWGCIPTKALLEHAHALKIAQDWKEWGARRSARPADRHRHGPGPGPQGQDRQGPDRRHRAAVQEEQDRLDQGQRPAGRQGQGRGHRRRDADADRAKEIIVATGSQPRSVPGIEIDRKRIITSDEAIGLQEMPKSIAIMGSGAVGVEFASIFRRFGSEVTHHRAAAAPGADRGRGGVGRAGEVVQEAGHQGADRHEGHQREGRRRRRRHRGAGRRRQDRPSSTPSTCWSRPAAARSPTGSAPRKLGLRMERGYIKVDERVPHQRAGHLGDRRRHHASSSPGHPQLAHLSSAEGIALAERIAGHESRPINYDQVPGCTYCDPGDRQRRPDREGGQGARLRRRDRHVPVRRAGPRADRRRDRRASSRSSPTRSTTRSSACT